MSEGKFVVCRCCGKRMRIPPGEPPCHFMEGWLTLSRWQGPHVVKHYNFCSLTCLKFWVEKELPEIPQVFLKSLEEE